MSVLYFRHTHFLFIGKIMDMKKRIILLSFLSAGLLVSCSKDEPAGNTGNTSAVERFEDLQVNDDFNWSTNSSYELELQGLKTLPFAKKGLIEVRNLDNELIARRNTEISQDLKFEFEAAAGIDAFVVSFGSISKQVMVSNNKAVFDYLPVDDTSDIDESN